MKTIEIDVERVIAETIEMYDYEYKTKKDIICQLIQSGVDVNSKQFIDYNKSAEESYRLFELSKLALEEKYVNNIPNRVGWNLIYNTCKLEVLVDED